MVSSRVGTHALPGLLGQEVSLAQLLQPGSPAAWDGWAWPPLGLALATACLWRETSLPREGVSERPDVQARRSGSSTSLLLHVAFGQSLKAGSGQPGEMTFFLQPSIIWGYFSFLPTTVNPVDTGEGDTRLGGSYVGSCT